MDNEGIGPSAGDREARVRQRAHEIWLREGSPEGMADEHWRQAEAEVGAEEGGAGAPSAGLAEAPARWTAGEGEAATPATEAAIAREMGTRDAASGEGLPTGAGPGRGVAAAGAGILGGGGLAEGSGPFEGAGVLEGGTAGTDEPAAAPAVAPRPSGGRGRRKQAAG